MADYRYAFDIQDSAVLRDGVNAETGIHQFTLRTFSICIKAALNAFVLFSSIIFKPLNTH
jgi:hypothetical protein